jgi:hypothetical protein
MPRQLLQHDRVVCYLNMTVQGHAIKFLKMWKSLSAVLIYERRFHCHGRPQNTITRHTGNAQWVILDETSVGCCHNVLTWFQQRFITLLLTTWYAETCTYESSILQITVLNSELSLPLSQQISGTKLTKKNFWEELSSYFILLRHGQHRKQNN